MTARIPVAAVKAMLQAEGLALVMELCPGGRREGNLWSCPNPSRSADTIGSFKVWLDAGAVFGAWKEYDAGDAEKGDIIDLIALAHRTDKSGAIEWARRRLGLDEGRNPGQARQVAAKANAAAAEREREEAERRASRRRRAFDIFSHATPILEEHHAGATKIVRRYLHRRKIHVAEIVGLETREIRATMLEHWMSARYENGRKVQSGWRGPAMVCAIRDAAGVVTGVHCTWVALDGQGKAPISQPKLMLGDVQGGVVRLTRGPQGLTVEEANAAGAAGLLILGEGIETCLSVATAVSEARIWAATMLGNIGFAPVQLACVEKTIVLRENDLKRQAQEAFELAIERLEGHGKPVATMAPHIGNDFNDLL